MLIPIVREQGQKPRITLCVSSQVGGGRGSLRGLRTGTQCHGELVAPAAGPPLLQRTVRRAQACHPPDKACSACCAAARPALLSATPACSLHVAQLGRWVGVWVGGRTGACRLSCTWEKSRGRHELQPAPTHVPLLPPCNTSTPAAPWPLRLLPVQVGCAMNCQFCYTGRMGLRGNLTAAQIVEQVGTGGVGCAGGPPRAFLGGVFGLGGSV